MPSLLSLPALPRAAPSSYHKSECSYAGQTSSWTGHDCSLRTCPTGDDPYTDGADEQQSVNCSATAGTFSLSFRDELSGDIAWDATAATIATTLQAMSTIGNVTVEFFAESLGGCAAENTVFITFKSDMGDMPMMVPSTASLTGGTGIIVSEVVKGSKENLECGGLGLCNEEDGVCECFDGYSSTNGYGVGGDRGDCGAVA